MKPTLEMILQNGLIQAMQSGLTAFKSSQPYEYCMGDRLVGAGIEPFELAVKTVPLRRRIDRFSSQDSAALLPGMLEDERAIAALMNAPNHPEVLKIASQLAGSPCTESLVTIDRLRDRDAIGIHNDANEHGEKLRLCWMLGEPTFSGGAFCIHPNATDGPLRRISHRRDRWVLFRISGESYHSVSRVHLTTTVERWTVIFCWGQRCHVG